MSYSLPGMNPWLENPLLWRNVHLTLISALRDELIPLLRPRYFVAVETHTFVTTMLSASSVIRYPDVMVIHRGGPVVAAPTTQASAGFMTVELPLDSVEVGYLEVRLVPNGEVITIIELLSHTNKQPGRDREIYIAKRDELLQTDVSFVEIDLLRAGPPMPFTEPAVSDYRLFIRRRDHPFHARLYPFSVRQPIPTFPLPLLPDDNEPVVDLGALLKTVYDRAGYDLVIDYNRPAVPPLTSEDAAWASELLTSGV